MSISKCIYCSLQTLSLLLYRVDRAAKVRCASLDLFCIVLQKVPLESDVNYFNIKDLVQQLCMGIKGSKVPSGVLDRY